MNNPGHTTLTASKPNPVIHLFPSLTDVAFVLPVIFMFWKLGGASHMLEGDTGWHIRTGEWILQHGRVPDTDIFSFTKPGEPWFAWEWLWDVLFAIIHQHLGLAGVVFVSLVVLCFTSVLTFRLVRRSCSNIFIVFAITWIAVAASSAHWLARPHLFTMLFTVVFLHVLERARAGARRALWLLVPLMVVWVNLHGGFVFGLAFLVAYAVGDLCAGLVESDKAAAHLLLRRSKSYAVTLSACLAGTLANPYFYDLHLHIFRTLTDPESPLYRFVGEWQPLNLRGPLAWYVEPMIVLAVAGAVWSLINRRFTHPLLVFAFLHSSFLAFRNMPIFMFVAAPIAAAVLEEGLFRLRDSALPQRLRNAAAALMNSAEEFGSMDRHWRIHWPSVAVLGALALAFFAAVPAENLRSEFDPKRYPVDAVNKLDRLLTGAVFTDDEWGDYLIYRLYPAGKVFVDGRFDLYGGEFTESYSEVMNGNHTWQSTLDKYAVRTVLLSVKTPLAGTLKESPRWSTVYDDGVALVFRLRQPTADTTSVVTHNGSLRDTSTLAEGVAVSRNLQLITERR